MQKTIPEEPLDSPEYYKPPEREGITFPKERKRFYKMSRSLLYYLEPEREAKGSGRRNAYGKRPDKERKAPIFA